MIRKREGIEGQGGGRMVLDGIGGSMGREGGIIWHGGI